jgi:hypothetical protein
MTSTTPQPFEVLMLRLNLSNADLVKASTKQQLTFKMVQKALKGRELSSNAQHKILEALRMLKPEENLMLKDVFK